MKRFICAFPVIIMLAGCSSGVSQAEYDSVVAQRDEFAAQIIDAQAAEPSATQSVSENAEYNFGYMKAPEVIYSTPSSENGLDSILMYVDGTVTGFSALPDDDSIEYIELDAEQGSLVLLLMYHHDEIDNVSVGDKIRAYFQYMGFSEVTQTGSGVYVYSKPAGAEGEPPSTLSSVNTIQMLESDYAKNETPEAWQNLYDEFLAYMQGSGVLAANGTQNAAPTESTTEAETEPTPSPTEPSTEPPAPETAPPSSGATMGQSNALAKARDYLDYTAFSYSGLIGQLEYEGFSTADATYGADNCGADWNEQAAAKAKDYIEYTSFSRDGLIDQLIYEGFTQSQAEYGATAIGY